jgi:hypothetical protein
LRTCERIEVNMNRSWMLVGMLIVGSLIGCGSVESSEDVSLEELAEAPAGDVVAEVEEAEAARAQAEVMSERMAAPAIVDARGTDPQCPTCD